MTGRRLIAGLLLAVFSLGCRPAIAEPKQDLALLETAPASNSLELRGRVSKTAAPNLNLMIDGLVEDALEQSASREELARKERIFNRCTRKIYAAGKDIAELATAYRGFEQSSEAADVILDEKVKLKSRASVAYAKQCRSDRLQPKVVAALMQLSMGLGLSNEQDSISTIEAGVDELNGLVGGDHAQKALESMSAWYMNLKLPPAVFKSGQLTPLQVESRCREIAACAAENDQVIAGIKGGLHKYNGRSKAARTTAKVVNTTLSLAALAPDLISPAAQVAWATFIMTQGGPEEAKLLREVYLAKRFESRWQMLYDEASLSVNSYNTAISSGNCGLMGFSQLMIDRLCQRARTPGT